MHRLKPILLRLNVKNVKKFVDILKLCCTFRHLKRVPFGFNFKTETMKHLKAMLAAASIVLLIAGCTPESQNSDDYQTEKDKNCPPNDTNCNGIPDNQE